MIRLKWLALAGAGRPACRKRQRAAGHAPAPPARDFSKVEIKTTDLGNKTYMLEGQGGNITVAVGNDGIIMVDGEFAPLHDKIKAAIEAVSKQPIKYLVNTHFHGDHTRRQRALRQGRRRRSWRSKTSRSASPKAPPTA